ncbi:MAG: hypothetical protein LBE55_00075 [Clostridiales bacterium]|nr:hypothetical protein [Clostridiales bacterium]
MMAAFITIAGGGAADPNYELNYKNVTYGIFQMQAEENTYISKYDANWFDEIQHIFGRGDDAIVRDIETGRTWAIRRTFGTNHADIEPLTKEDAAIMNAVWGGHSWARRPVVVYVGNYVFAGSLTNFPHAGVDSAAALATVGGRSGGYGHGLNFDAVAGNGVDGHMCLHFAGSLLHGSNRPNPDHQKAVARAIEYIRANY